MCKWGTTEGVWVNLHPDISCTGKEETKEIKADKCIASIIRALNEGGIMMKGSCCGHDKRLGEIELADGRIILIFKGDFCQYLNHEPVISRYMRKKRIMITDQK